MAVAPDILLPIFRASQQGVRDYLTTPATLSSSSLLLLHYRCYLDEFGEADHYLFCFKCYCFSFCYLCQYHRTIAASEVLHWQCGNPACAITPLLLSFLITTEHRDANVEGPATEGAPQPFAIDGCLLGLVQA